MGLALKKWCHLIFAFLVVAVAVFVTVRATGAPGVFKQGPRSSKETDIVQTILYKGSRKKVIFLMVGPLRGGGGRGVIGRTLRKNFFETVFF